jgi:hypothetical protein
VKEAKSGKWYAAVNAYKPKESKPAAKPAAKKIGDSYAGPHDDDVPF